MEVGTPCQRYCCDLSGPVQALKCTDRHLADLSPLLRSAFRLRDFVDKKRRYRKVVFSVVVIPAARVMLPDARAAFLQHLALREPRAPGGAIAGEPMRSA